MKVSYPKYIQNSLKIFRTETFNHVNSWLNDAKNAARNDCSICLVGNKSDLKDLRQVSYNEAAKFSQNNSTIKLFEIINFVNRFATC